MKSISISQAIFLSALLHTLLAFLRPETKSISSVSPATLKKTAIKVIATPAKSESESESEDSGDLDSSKLTKGAAEVKPRLNQITEVEQKTKPQTSAAKSTSQKLEPSQKKGSKIPIKRPKTKDLWSELSYEKLLKLSSNSGATGPQSRHENHRGGPLENENGLVALKKGIKNYSNLSQFAGELSEYVVVPEALAMLETSGRAEATYSRKKLRKGTKNSFWYVKRVKGDRYVRAVIYEALEQVSKNEYAQSILNKNEYKTVKILITYDVLPDLDVTFKPFTVKIANNTIAFHYSFKTVEQAWAIAGVQENPNGQAKSYLNLFGVGLLIVDSFLDKDLSADPDLRKLRRSPAYNRPIIR